MTEETLSYLAGLIIGDGHIERKKPRVVISTNSDEFKDIITDLLRQVGCNPFETFDKSGGNLWRISVVSKQFKHELESRGLIEGNKTVADLDVGNNLVPPLLAGLYDAEGWFELDKGRYYRLRMKMKNESIMRFVDQQLKELGIRHMLNRKDRCFVADINSQKDVKGFLQKVNLLHPKWKPVVGYFRMAKGPIALGYTRPTMRRTMRCNAERRS